MAMPRSVTKVSKHGVTFVSDVDRAQYTIRELSRAALKDVAKFLRRMMIAKLKKLQGLRRSKRIYNSTQYWVRKIETDLQIGMKHDTWYGAEQELGTKNQPRRSIVRDTVFENIPTIRDIEARYLSAIEDEIKARKLIDEEEGVPDGQDD